MTTIPLQFKSCQSQVVIGIDLIKEIARLIAPLSLEKKCVVITHPNLNEQYGHTLIQALEEANYQAKTIEVPEGEIHKRLSTIEMMVEKMAEYQLERSSFVLALGGGVIGDMAGFAASIYLRGIPVIQIPSTLLAQVDSSIGGKTGVNLTSGKNLAGTFYQPLMTIIDLSLLNSLPDNQIRCGLAEIVKYGVINQPGLFEFLWENAHQIFTNNTYTRDLKIWEMLINWSVEDKAYVVTQDEKEHQLRAILNFGHTIGHAIEAAFDYQGYLHGEAVAIGMVCASKISVRLHLITEADHQRLTQLLDRLGFDTRIPQIDPDTIINFLYADKKVKDGRIRFVLPTGIGSVVIRDDISIELIREVIQ